MSGRTVKWAARYHDDERIQTIFDGAVERRTVSIPVEFAAQVPVSD